MLSYSLVNRHDKHKNNINDEKSPLMKRDKEKEENSNN